MTAAELRARLAYALHLQQSRGLSTPAALAIAWGLAPEPPLAPVARRARRPRVHSRRRQPLPAVRPVLRQRSALASAP